MANGQTSAMFELEQDKSLPNFRFLPHTMLKLNHHVHGVATMGKTIKNPAKPIVEIRKVAAQTKKRPRIGWT